MLDLRNTRPPHYQTATPGNEIKNPCFPALIPKHWLGVGIFRAYSLIDSRIKPEIKTVVMVENFDKLPGMHYS